jgi:lipopolysaccharide heptosyltransferase I
VKILAIRFARLGDVILLLPALASLKAKFPNSELTLLTGHRCAPIAELCPHIDEVLSVDRLAIRDGPAWRALSQMRSLIRDVRRRRFDLVVDFHSFRETNLLAWLSGAPVRIGMKRYKAPFLGFCFNSPPVIEDKSLHVAEMFQKVVAAVPAKSGFSQPDRSRGVLGRLSIEKAREKTVVLYVDAPVPERIWPPEKFAEIADFASERLGAAVIVISSSERAELTSRIKTAVRNREKLKVFTDLDLKQLSATIASGHLLVSNDTGPMHIGPAVGVPTVGLFSVGYPEHFRPTGEHDRFLRGNPIQAIETSDVVKVIGEIWDYCC